MRGLMGDNNIQGQFAELLQIILSPYWREVWDSLGVSIETFETLELDRETPDAIIWQTCQLREIVLVTANRNEERPDSLQSAIRTLGGRKVCRFSPLPPPNKFSRTGPMRNALWRSCWNTC